MDIEKRIKRARVQLIIKRPWLAAGVLNLNVKYGIVPSGYAAVYSDGTVVFDKEKCKDLSDEELQYLWAHEVLHCAFLHLVRRGSRDVMLWNLATDIAIDQILKDQGMVVVDEIDPPEGYHLGMSAEQVYALIHGCKPQGGGEKDEHHEEAFSEDSQDREENNKDSDKNDSKDNKDKGKGADKDKEKEDKDKGKRNGKGKDDKNKEGKDKEQGKDEEGEGKDKEQGKDEEGEGKDKEQGKDEEGEGKDKEQGKDEEGEGKDKEQGKDEEGEGKDKEQGKDEEGERKDKEQGKENGEGQKGRQKNEEKWQRIAVEMFHAFARGQNAGALEEIIREVISPRIPWRTLLSNFVQTKRKSGQSWLPPNRRMLGQGIILPGYYEEVLRVVVAIDTSGSISTEDLRVFCGAMKDILEGVKSEMTVIQCDASIQEIKENITIDEIKEIQIKGRGGTDFRPVFEWVKMRSDEYDCLIYLTDGNGTYPRSEDVLLSTLWVLTQDWQIPEGVGERIVMREL